MLHGSDLSPDSELQLGSDTSDLHLGSDTSELHLGSDIVLSDASSDSGVSADPRQRLLVSPGLEDGPRMLGDGPRMLMSPGLDESCPHSPAHSLDIIDYISNGEQLLID